MKLSVQLSIRVPWLLVLRNEECGFREGECYVGPSKGIFSFETWSPQDPTSFKDHESWAKQFEHPRNSLPVAEAAQSF